MRHLLEVRQRSFLQRRRVALDGGEIEIARILDAQPPDPVLGDLEHDEAALRILLRDRDRNRLKALVVIRLLHRRARLLDVVGRAAGAEERIDGRFDLDLRQAVGALDAKLVDIESCSGEPGFAPACLAADELPLPALDPSGARRRLATPPRRWCRASPALPPILYRSSIAPGNRPRSASAAPRTENDRRAIAVAAYREAHATWSAR